MGASLANRSAFIVPSVVSIVAEYVLLGSICMGGGEEYCLGAAADTDPPWADGDAPGLGMAVRFAETWAPLAWVGAVARVGVGAGVVLGPHAAARATSASSPSRRPATSFGVLKGSGECSRCPERGPAP